MGNFSVINNLPGLAARQEAQVSGANLQKTLFRISSGLRLRTGGDDAAGLAIADNLKAQYRTLGQSIRNANDGVGYLQTADSALGQVSNLLTRAASLLSQAASLNSNDGTEMTAITNELAQLFQEIDRIGGGTKFGGQEVFSGDTKNIFVGDTQNNVDANNEVNSNAKISATVSALTTSGLGVSEGVTGSGSSIAVSFTLMDGDGSPGALLAQVATAIDTVASERGTIGSAINRLENAVAVMQAQVQNLTAAESQIRDANMAEEIANMTKFQILSQTGIAALAQANAQSQSVLALFR
jgi:flagellin